MAKKSSCSITRAGFRAKAKPVTVVINGAPLLAEKKTDTGLALEIGRAHV